MTHLKRYNLNIKKWGRAGWVYLMSIALQYPIEPTDSDKTNYRLFFTANQYVIPCPMCRQHYAENLIKHPLTDAVLSTRRSLAEWINTMRNEVNIANEKPEVDVLHMIADYMTPTMAESMLHDKKELEELRQIDTVKNQAYLQTKEATRKFHRKELITEWWFWLLMCIFILLVVMFLFFAIKSVCKRKTS